MLSRRQGADQNLLTNLNPRSDIISSGKPCFYQTCCKKHSAKSFEVAVTTVGMKIAILVKRSATIRMESKPPELGSCLMQSTDKDDHGRSASAVNELAQAKNISVEVQGEATKGRRKLPMEAATGVFLGEAGKKVSADNLGRKYLLWMDECEVRDGCHGHLAERGLSQSLTGTG